MANTRIPVLDFHGNGSVVCLEGIKLQASSKPQAKRDSTGALPGKAESTVASLKRATNCRATIRPLTKAPSSKHPARGAKHQALVVWSPKNLQSPSF